MKISYTKKGDYLLPDLILENKKQYNIGKYGLLRLNYIKKYKLGLYSDLLASDKLNEYLHNINTTVKTEYDNKGTNNSKRIIKLSEVLNLKLKSIKDNYNTGYKQNFKQYNNKLNKKEDSIYYKDEDGNEYWHSKLITKNEATIEEQEELKKLLSDIYEEE